MKRIYLDYAATTPMDPAVRRAMEPYFAAVFGNPGSLHRFGQEAIAAVDRAREGIARGIGADFREVVFTGSATEANNLALRGTLKAAMQNVKSKNQSGSVKFKNFIPRIIISAIEHESVRETARDLEREGVEVVEIPVSREGVVDLREFRQALDAHTVLVSVMYANNEIGTVQPIAEIADIIRNFREKRSKENGERKVPLLPTPFPLPPLLHTDAVQAFQFLDCSVRKLGVDMMTLSGHKIYGPKGIGALYVRGTRNTSPLFPVVTGGGQEFGFRSGTENVPAIVGFAEAVRRAAALRTREAARIALLRRKLWEGIRKKFSPAMAHGFSPETFTGRSFPMLPNILSVHFPRLRAEHLLARLDAEGVAASAGPACSSRSPEVSKVLRAIGITERQARASVRFSLGKYTHEEDIERAVSLISRAVSGI